MTPTERSASMPDRMPIVARCEKCGREFVWARPEHATDGYPDLNVFYSYKNKNRPKNLPPCGGRIIHLLPKDSDHA